MAALDSVCAGAPRFRKDASRCGSETHRSFVEFCSVPCVSHLQPQCRCICMCSPEAAEFIPMLGGWVTLQVAADAYHQYKQEQLTEPQQRPKRQIPNASDQDLDGTSLVLVVVVLCGRSHVSLLLRFGFGRGGSRSVKGPMAMRVTW